MLNKSLTATGAWFTSSKAGTSQNIDGTFGTISINYADGEAAAWSALDVTGGNEKVMPGSSIQLNGGTVTNSSNVASYIKVSIVNLVVKIDDTELTEAQIKGLFGVTEVPAFAVTAGDGVEATSKDGIYKANAGKTVTLNNINLTIAKAVKNGTALSADGLTVKDGSVINFTFQIKVAAVQADYITLDEAETVLNGLFA